MQYWAASPGHSVAYISNVEIASHAWRRVRWARRAYLEMVTRSGCVVYGVHLSAVHSNLTEQRRAYELRALLSRHDAGRNAQVSTGVGGLLVIDAEVGAGGIDIVRP